MHCKKEIGFHGSSGTRTMDLGQTECLIGRTKLFDQNGLIEMVKYDLVEMVK